VCLKSRTGKFRAAGKISIILAPALWTGMAIGAGCKIAKIRRSKAAEGQADMSAAAAIWPSIAEDFAKRGITP
jgi:hypothetical protein